MKGEGRLAYCEQCREEEEDKQSPPSSVDAEAASGVDQRIKQNEWAVVLRNPRQPFDQPYMPPLTAMGISDSSSHPAFSQPVEDTGGSALLRELQTISSQMEVHIRHRGRRVLPLSARLLQTAGDPSSIQAELQAGNLSYTGATLYGLSDLLKRGKVIVRLLQTDGLVTLLHIHSSGNLAVLIMENGQSTTATDPEKLTLMLTNTFALVSGIQIEVYLHTGSEAQQVSPGGMETTGGEGGRQMVAGISSPPSQPQPPVSSIAQKLTDFINRFLEAEALPGRNAIGNAAKELAELVKLAPNSCLEAINALMLVNQHELIISSVESAGVMFEWQAPLLIHVSDESQSSIISIQPLGDMAQITMANGQAFLVSRAAINHLFNWLVDVTGWRISMYIAMFFLRQ